MLETSIFTAASFVVLIGVPSLIASLLLMAFGRRTR